MLKKGFSVDAPNKSYGARFLAEKNQTTTSKVLYTLYIYTDLQAHDYSN